MRTSTAPPVLRELRHVLQRQAERGTTAGQDEPARADLARHAEGLADIGLTAFRAVLADGTRAGERILRANYLCLQYERLTTGELEGGTPG